MKIIFYLFVSFLLLNINCSQEAKNALIEFIKTIKNGLVINLSEQCLGRVFDYHYLLLSKNFKEENFKKLSKNLENIGLDMIVNCPGREILSILNDTKIQDLKKLPFQNKYNLATKIFKVGFSLYSEYNNNSLTGVTLGQALGKIVLSLQKKNIETNEETETETETEKGDLTDESSSFLNKIKPEDYLELIGGLFNGMKEKENEGESECYKDIVKGQNKILEHIDNGMKEMEKGKGIGKTITSIIFNLVTVEGLVVDCNLLSLGSSVISKLTSIKEATELVNKIIKNSTFYLLYVGQIVDSYKKGQMKETGKYIGKILSDVFDFHVK
jgi:hypothetical protein